jgi:RHS repeat-associated protein
VRTGNDTVGTGWTFVHGPGLDDPVVGYYASSPVTKAYFVTDGNGRQYAVGTAGGSPIPIGSGLNDYKYAGGTNNSQSFAAERMSTTAVPGLSFFRNRFYDQGTGRWTQEDPLGTAGGVNLYQFNGNNPLAYTDPFGLCDVKEDPTCALANAVGGRVQPLEDFVDRLGDVSGVTGLGEGGEQLRRGHLAAGIGLMLLNDPIAGEELRAVSGTYSEVRAAIKGSGLQAHHLIEKRFARFFGKAGHMLSAGLSPEVHQAFTNAWRTAIPYGRGTAAATGESVLNAAREIYKDSQQILNALGL